MLRIHHSTDYLEEVTKSKVVDSLEQELQNRQNIRSPLKLKRYRRYDSDDERNRNRALFSAIHEDDFQRVKQLLDSGVQVNVIDRNNVDNTPLHYAVKRGRKRIAKLLLARGADIAIQNSNGKTPLDIAQDEEVINILKNHFRLSLNEESFTKIDVPADGSCLFWAASLAYLSPVKYMDDVFRERFARLFGSSHSQELAKVQNLIKAYDPFSSSGNVRDDDTLRTFVTEIFRSRIIDEISSHQSRYDESITINDFLHSKNEGYMTGGTFQIKFRGEFRSEIKKYSIDIKILRPDILDETKIRQIDKELDKIPDKHRVKQFKFRRYLECMRDSKSWGGNHEIQAMSQVLHCDVLVFSDGTKHSIKYDSGNDQIQLLNSGQSHYNFCLVKAPILMAAIKNNQRQEAQTYLSLGIDDVNYEDGEKWTALHFAAERGDTEVIQMLLIQGARPDIRNHLDQSALDVARLYGKDNALSLLRGQSQVIASKEQVPIGQSSIYRPGQSVEVDSATDILSKDTKKRLEEFVEYFVKESEDKLHVYHMFLEGEVKRVGKLTETFSGKIGQGVGAAGGGVVGYFLGSPAIGARAGGAAGAAAGEALGNRLWKKHHTKKIASLVRLIDKFQEDRASFRQELVRAGFDVFQSFEMQFMGITTDISPKDAMHKLAKDAINRAINYLKEHDVSISEGVILGKSKKEETFSISPGFEVKYQSQLSQKAWNTAVLYNKVGLLVTLKNKRAFYKKKESASNTGKYGYRRLLESENWDVLKGNYEIDDTVEKEFRDYQYVIHPKNLEKETKDILERINLDDKDLAEERIRKVLKEVKDDMMEEINVLKRQSHGYAADRKVLANIESRLKNLKTDQYLREFKQQLEEAKRERQEIIEEFRILKEEIGKFEQSFRETGMDVKEMKHVLLSSQGLKEKAPIWFDVRESVTSFTASSPGRLDKLDEIASGLEQGMVVISGLGGVGKSELAIRHARSKYSQEDSVIWINAQTPQTLRESFCRLAKEELKVSIRYRDIGEEKDTRSIVKDVYKFFANRKSLLIFDNAERYNAIKEFLPISDYNEFHILITSINSLEWKSETENIKVLKLEDFENEEAILFIKKVLQIDNDSQSEEMQNLAKKLHNFPYVLRYAVNYIKESDEEHRKRGSEYRISDFLEKYENTPRGLLDSQLQPYSRDQTTLFNIVSTLKTWNIAFGSIRGSEYGQEALRMLNMMVYLGPNNIPERVFLSELADNDLDKLISVTRLLEKYLIVRLEGQGMLSMHGLAQEVIRLGLKGQQEEETLANVLRLLKEHMAHERSIVNYVPHIISVWNYANGYDKLIEEFIVNDDSETTYFRLIAEGCDYEVVDTILRRIERNHPDELSRVINAESRRGKVPLHYAIRGGNERTIRLLIEKGADVNARDNSYHRPLHLAARYGYVEVVKVLVSKNADINAETSKKFKFTALHLAAQNAHSDIVSVLLKAGADVNARTRHKYTSLHFAAQNGDLTVANILLNQEGVEVDARNGYLFTPLHFAADNGQLEVAQVLILKGADINALDRGHFTPLHLAALKGRLTVVHYLLADGRVKVDAQTTLGNSPLHLAAGNGRLEIVMDLIENGADTEIENIKGKKPVDLAVEGGHIDVESFIASHSKSLAITSEGGQVDKTFRRRKGGAGAGGQFYEIHLSTLFLLKGLSEEIDSFYLASNMEEADNFDDIVFKYKYFKNGVERSKIIFLQAKRKDKETLKDTEKKITIKKLLSDADADFSLQKYFTSYLKIKQQFLKPNTGNPIFEGKFDNLDCDFVIYTNALPSFSTNIDGIEQLEESIEKLSLRGDSILNFAEEDGSQGRDYYKLRFGQNRDKEIVDVLKYSSDCNKLARELAKSFFPGSSQKKHEGMDIKKPIFQYYRIPLVETVLEMKDSKNGKFRDSFLDGDESLSASGKKFRSIFFKEVGRIATKSEDLLISELRGKGVKLSNKFWSIDKVDRSEERKLSLPSDSIDEDNTGDIKDFLSKLKLLVNHFDEGELGEIIKHKIQTAYGVAQQDIDSVSSEVKEKVQKWWYSEDTYLTKSDRFVQDAVRISISFEVQKPVDLFTGRTEELNKLHNTLHGQSKAVISQIASVTGLGGVGKSELARKYINDYAEEYDNNVIWINAATYETMEQSFRSLAQGKLGINTKDMYDKERDIDSVLPEVYKFFTERHRKSIFIFDNAGKHKTEKERDEGIDKFLPDRFISYDSNKSHVLITSRNQAWEDVNILQLDVFTEAEAIDFIREALKMDAGSQEDEIKLLAHKLQRLPLGLTQAVAHIKMENKRLKLLEGTFTIKNYLDQYEEKAEDLLKLELDQEYGSYTQTVFATWTVTVDNMKQKEMCGEQALEVMDIIAYLAPEKIPIQEVCSKLIRDEKVLRRAVELLDQYSLARRDPGTLNMHRLVQQVTRINLKKQNREEEIVGRVFKLLEEGFPYDSDTLDDCKTKKKILPHLEKFVENMDTWQRENPAKVKKIEEKYILKSLTWMSDGYSDLGNYRREKELLERALGIEEEYHGDETIHVARTLLNLGNAYGDLGDPDKQRELLERALRIAEELNEEGKFEVARTLANLGNAYGDLGDFKKQKELLETALPLLEKYYGNEHFRVSSALVNLSSAYRHLGDHSTEKALLERALRIDEKYYDTDHFQVAKTLANLGDAYGSLGDHERERELLERALHIEEKHYGPDHFEVASTLVNLSDAYEILGDPEKQKALLERAIPILEKYYTRDHFHVATALVNLSNVYWNLGDFHQQKDLLERALFNLEKQYGRDHVQTVGVLRNLGSAYGDLGDFQKQKEFLERALPIVEKHHGSNHLQVAKVLSSLGNDAYKDLGDSEKQKEVLEKALPILEQHDSENYDVALTLVNLGNIYGDLGNRQEQRDMLKRALAIQEEIYGPDSFRITTTLESLSKAYEGLGDYKKQKDLLERTLNIKENFFGTRNFQVAATLESLGNAYGALGNYRKTYELFERASKITKQTPLHLAVFSSNPDMVRRLLERYPRNMKKWINVQDSDGDAPLMYAAHEGNANAAETLLEYGANVNAKDKDGVTALHSAAKGSHWETAATLLRNRANVNDLSPGQKRDLLSYLGDKPAYRDITRRLSSRSSQIQSYAKQQKAFLRLSKFASHHFPLVQVEAVKQGLYLPSFEARNIEISGKCAAITRMFSQILFLGQPEEGNGKLPEMFLNNLQSSAEIYERVAQGKQISVREREEIFALSKLSDNFEEQLDSPLSSLPSSFSHTKSYKHFDDLSHYVRGLNDDFAIHLVTSNHVTAIYRAGDSFAFFDINVALVSNIKTAEEIMMVVKKGVSYAGYEVAEDGFLVEHFDVSAANGILTPKQRQTLTSPIQTERNLLSLQDQEFGPIALNGRQVRRVTLYDIGTKLHPEGSSSVLINAEVPLNNKNLPSYIDEGKVTIAASEYLEKLGGSSKEMLHELVQTTSSIPFEGSIRAIQNAKNVQHLVLSENNERPNFYELNKVLKTPIEQSLKALPYYQEVTNTKHWPNRLTNAAGRISMAKGLYDIAHSVRYGDATGFLLGSGEMSFALFSQLIEDGIVKITPKLIKQLKHGILLSRGFAGIISSPFDIYDLVSSSIDLANAETGSKEWRDSIAGVTLSASSVVTSIAFTALGKPGVGTVIGLGIILTQGFYSGSSMVMEYRKYRLTTDQKFRLFWHTFALQLPPEDVQYLSARQDVVNQLAQQAWEYLQNNPSIAAYALGLGDITLQDSARSKRMIGVIGTYHISYRGIAKATKDWIPKPKTVVVEPGSSYIVMSNPSNDRNGRELSRVIPISPSPEARMLCLPTFTHRNYEHSYNFGKKPIYNHSHTAIYYCDNSMIIGYNNATNSSAIVFDLSLINDGLIVSNNDYQNNFMISHGELRIYGSSHTYNRFTLTRDDFEGKIVGGEINATNILDISQLKSEIVFYTDDEIRTESSKMTIKNVSHFIGRSDLAEHVRCENMDDKMMIDGRGGNSRNNDVVHNCKQVVVTGSTRAVSNEPDTTFYIKPSPGDADIDGKGFIIFSDTSILQRASRVTYSEASNKLSVQITLEGDKDYAFTLHIDNYLNEDKSLNYIIVDKYGSNIEPMIQPDSARVKFFNLKAETDLSTPRVISQWYDDISQSNDYAVYGIVKHSGENYMIFGSKDSDIIPITKSVTFVQGNEEGDIYNFISEEGISVTINNFAEDRAIDMLHLPANSAQARKIENDLCITTDGEISNIKIENYFVNDAYKHLAIIDQSRQVFVPVIDKGPETDLIPFYHATNNRRVFSVATTNYSMIAVDASLSNLLFYRDHNDLLLVEHDIHKDNSLLVKLEGFYSAGIIDFLYLWRDKYKLYLAEIAKLAISYQEAIRSAYESSVREYSVDLNSTSSTIDHNTGLQPSIGVLRFLNITPGVIRLTESRNDLIFSCTSTNHTITIRNWNNTLNRISILRFDQLPEIAGIEKLEAFEIQMLLNKAQSSYSANKKLQMLNAEVVNGFRYLLASSGVVKEADVCGCLGFSSKEDQQQFIDEYSSHYHRNQLRHVLQDSLGVETVVWLIAKGYSDLFLKGPDREKFLLLDDLGQCFEAVMDRRTIVYLVRHLEGENGVSRIERFIHNHREKLREEMLRNLREQGYDLDATATRNRRAINDEYLESAATRSSNPINNFVRWVKAKSELFMSSVVNSIFITSEGYLPKLLEYRSFPTENIQKLVDFSQIDTNGTLLLLDVFIRKFTGQKYVPSADQSIASSEVQANALRITKEFEKTLKQTSIHCGIAAINFKFDSLTAQSTIAGQIRSGSYSKVAETLFSTAKKACPQFKQSNKFLTRLKYNLEKMVSESEGLLPFSNTKNQCKVFDGLRAGPSTSQRVATKPKLISYTNNCKRLNSFKSMHAV